MSEKSPRKRRRWPSIGWQEADKIGEELRASSKDRVAVADIASAHRVSQLTIRKIAAKRGILVAP